jgi:DNA-entry nuclease
MACVGPDIMPTEERGDISSVKPTGWKQAKYDVVPGKYLYDRCHLIGYQLTGENDNVKNLITGTGYMNVDGMLPFENMIADYVKDTGNHVMYRVTPIFKNYDLVARGVLMEAYSVEDNGDGIEFCVYCYNNQPGVSIDYYDGTSWLNGETPPERDESTGDGEGDGEGEGDATTPDDSEITYILNTSKSSMKIHKPTCSKVPEKEENKLETTRSLEELIEDGYSPCGICKPDQP